MFISWIPFRIRVLLLGMLLLFTACGYKPSSHKIESIFGEKIYVEVSVDRINPENAAFIQDEMNRLVYRHFKSQVSDKASATQRIYLSYIGSTFSPISYQDGYVTRYRANINVQFRLETKQGKISKSISAVHEADIEASSLTSSTLRTKAIRKGLEKALEEFLAYVSAKAVSGE